MDSRGRWRPGYEFYASNESARGSRRSHGRSANGRADRYWQSQDSYSSIGNFDHDSGMPYTQYQPYSSDARRSSPTYEPYQEHQTGRLGAYANDHRHDTQDERRSVSPRTWSTNNPRAHPSSPKSRSFSKEPIPTLPPASPTPSYLSLCLQPLKADSVSTSRKLLILDLNGTLVWRTKRNHGPNRRINPRPYMKSFTSYVTSDRSGLDTMIWSSAMPENVQKMAEECFGERLASLKTIWARDTLGLSPNQYGKKVQTVKDLRTIWSKVPDTSARNTILLDDSALKAQNQPYNHLILPEYNKGQYEKDRELISSGHDLEADPEGHDQTLLAIIGILDEAVKYENIAAWMRSGGVWGNKEIDPDERTDAGTGEGVPVVADGSAVDDLTSAPTIASPNTEANKVWFLDNGVAQFWVLRGKEALERLEIPLQIV